jgi:pimeloyl-ACP methyl ester carboxylesterase
VPDFLGADASSREDLDPARLPAPAGTTVLLHGLLDEIVPIAVAESYAAAQPRSRLVAVPDAAHFAVIDPLSPAWSAVLAELGRLAEPAAV